MNEESDYQKIIRYVDEMNQDLRKLAQLVEKEMGTKGYSPLASPNSKIETICWNLTRDLDDSLEMVWRLPYLLRGYHTSAPREFAFYMVLLESGSAFAFPAVICGRVRLMSDLLPTDASRATHQAFHSQRLKTLAAEDSKWDSRLLPTGWYQAIPRFRSKVENVTGYVLDGFSLVSRQHVVDNIVLPLTDDGQLENLQLTVPYYPFSGYKEGPQTAG